MQTSLFLFSNDIVDSNQADIFLEFLKVPSLNGAHKRNGDLWGGGTVQGCINLIEPLASKLVMKICCSATETQQNRKGTLALTVPLPGPLLEVVRLNFNLESPQFLVNVSILTCCTG